MHKIEIGPKIKRQLPSSWNELTGKQLVQILAGSLTFKDHLLRKYRLSVLLDIPQKLVNKFSDVQVLELHRMVRFLDGEGPGLTAQLFPKIKVPGMLGPSLFGPRERIRNLTFIEFIYADTYFTAYARNQSPDMLHHFIACLYRERHWFHFLRKRLPSYDGDCRQEFNSYQVQRRAHQVAKLPLALKLAIVLWFQGCRAQLEKEFDLVFTEGRQQQAVQKGWDGVLLGISKEAIHIDATGKVNIRNILALMQQRFEELEKSKQRHEN